MEHPFDADKAHPSWKPFFDRADVTETLSDIEKAIGDDYYPTRENVLRFASNDLDQVRHVIVGMDPYPSWNAEKNCPQATGRSFEVSELAGEDWDYKIKQASLRNILKALHYNATGRNIPLKSIRMDIELGLFAIASPTQWFDALEAQGVLFLNSTLTVAPERPGSHRALWQPFREQLIPYMIDRGITWHLWGKDAQGEYGELLAEGEKILRACHPRLAEFVHHNTFTEARDVNWLGTDKQK